MRQTRACLCVCVVFDWVESDNPWLIGRTRQWAAYRNCCRSHHLTNTWWVNTLIFIASRRVDDWSILVWCHMPLAPLQCELQRNVLRVYVLTINRNTITCSPGWRHRTPLRVKWIYLKCQTCFLQMQNLSIHELIWASPLFCLYVQAKLNWKISRYVEMR